LERGTPAPAAWYGDPDGRHERRYWDGKTWTDQVADGPVVGSSAMIRQREPQPFTQAQVRRARHRVVVTAPLVVVVCVLDLTTWHGHVFDIVVAIAVTLVSQGQRSRRRWAQILGRLPPDGTSQELAHHDG
jgi:hypothetical protein